LVTNAIKYAYDDGRGEVEVELTSLPEDQLLLSVVDHGNGLPTDFDPSGQTSLGIKLISSLSRQLGGEPEWTSMDRGTGFTLRFEPAIRG
jgi:two-component sensor histidine kinase